MSTSRISDSVRHQDENRVNTCELSQTPLFSGRVTPPEQNQDPNRQELTIIDQSDAPASKATLPREHFKYRGRKWRIFKRSPNPDSNWYFYFEANKERIGPLSLGSSSKQHALAEAKLKIDLHYTRREAALRGSMMRPDSRTYSLISAIIGHSGQDDFGVLLTIPTRKMASVPTRKQYAWSLRWCLKLALNLEDDAKVDQLSSSILNKALARKFFDAVALHAANLPDQAERNSYLRSAYGIYASAIAIFAPRPLEAMRTSHNLRLPSKNDIDEFREGEQTYGQHVPPANQAVLPSDSLIARTLREWIRIAETPGYQIPGGDRNQHGRLAPLSELDRRNVFITVGVELSCGFRVSETRRIRRSWITTEKGLPVVRDLDTAAKDQTGKIEVSPLDPFWRILWYWVQKNKWDVAESDLLLTARSTGRGALTDRSWWPEKLVCLWLRHLGWETQKTNHALRDFSASMITMRYGLGEACDWCRHKNMATTERNYSRFVKLSKRVDARKLAWIRWSRFTLPAPSPL